MYTVFKKTFLACILVLVALTTGAWQSNKIVFAESQNTNIPETPLYPGLTWSSLGSSSRDITINVNGDTISMSGEAYKAAEQFASGIIFQDVLTYYSNEQLAKLGWASYDVSKKSDGAYYIFYHESGVYLSIEFLKCPDDSSSICLTIWKSEQTNPTTVIPNTAFGPGSLATATGSFGKTSPANGTTNLNPTSITLSWGTYSPTPDKYSYCVKEGSACDASDPGWTGTYTNTSVTLTGLSYDKTYYWQVKAITCISCVPKTVVYADSGTVWTFKTKQNTQAVILGNAGVAGATLSYVDGSLKTVTADGTGAYSITVPFNWSGTVTPTKSGYLFLPKSASFSNLTVAQTIQNFTAVVAFTISGNVGVSGVTLSYTDVTPQTVMSDSSSNYSIMVPQGWSGAVTPSKTGFSFSPNNKSYVNVVSNQAAQNYLALVTISGNAGIAGATLSYTDGTPKTVIADGSGNYSITVPLNWSGAVTPSKTGYAFSPTSRNYVTLAMSQSAQNYIALVTISGNVGIADATVSYTDGTLKTNLADGIGNYAITVPYNWSGTVTPGKACYAFSPANHVYASVLTSQTVQDFTATYNANITYTLTGNTGVSGVTLSYIDGTPKAVISDGSGSYSITVPCNWSGTITPSLTGYLFAPAIKNYNMLIGNTPSQNYYLYNVTPADFNGDHKTDIAVFRPSTGTWHINGQGTIILGQAGDIPVPADYNGDGLADIAVFHPSNSTWYINGQSPIVYGAAGDIPVVADYNGDGKADIAVFRPSNSTWYIRGQGPFVYGADGDIPVVADYNGDGKADIAVFRPTNSTWYLYGIGPRVYGTVGDIPVVADYNGDGKADIAVFRPTNSTWYLYGVGPKVYGTLGDIPAIGDYDGDGKADITVFRPTNSTWYKYGVGPSVFGTIGDIPV